MTAFSQSTQSDSIYVFSSGDVKKIAYAIESRKILIQDTSDYKKIISQLELKVSETQEVVQRLNQKNNQSDLFINVLENDVDSLMLERHLLMDINKSLNSKNKNLKTSLPIVFIIGIAIGLL